MSALHRMAVLAALLPAAALAGEVAGASPRNMVLELKLSPYTPNIDSGFAPGAGPYARFYGGGPMILGELEFDYQFFQKFGSLGLGLSVGYGEKGAFAHLADGSVSDQAAAFHLAPVKALLVYRFDWLFTRFDIPLVPYLKGGPVLIPWWMTKGTAIETDNGKQAAGFKVGAAAVAGLALAIDFLDPRLARDFDVSMGVNHTYLFAEFAYQNASLLPTTADNPRPLNLDSLHWMFGLGLEF